jgi:hypothetical protein
VVGEAGFGPVASTWAYALEPALIIVSVDEPITRSLSTILELTRGTPRWSGSQVTSTARCSDARSWPALGTWLSAAAHRSTCTPSLIQARRADQVRSMDSAPSSRPEPRSRRLHHVGR